MAYQVLARKYRPQTFAGVIGQEHVTRTLKNAIDQRRIAHGYIFSGHRGIGKTTVARILAMALNCRSSKDNQPVSEPCGVCDSCVEVRAGSSVDVIEIDAATNRGIDEIRELREAARYRPARDRYKIYILDEAHQITDAAFNALLKTLEEPPSHVVFMMATTQPEDIPQTIRSRCQHFSFHAVRFEEMVRQLRWICERENISADEEALGVLADAGDGSLRDALSVMDQAIACCGTTLTAPLVLGLVGAVPGEVLERILQAVAENSSDQVLRLVDKLLSEGQSPTHFVRQLVRFLRNTLVARLAGGDSPSLQLSTDERARVARVANLFSEEDLTRFLQVTLRTHGDVSYKSEQRFHLELGLLKLVHLRRLLPIEQLLSEGAGDSGAKGDRTPLSSAPLSSPGVAARDRDAQPPVPPPFEQDRARKAGRVPEMSAGRNLGEAPLSNTGFAATGAARAPVAPESALVAVASREPEPALEADAIEGVRAAALHALEEGGHRMLASTLCAAEWSLNGGELLVRAAVARSLLEMALGPEPIRVATAAAGKVAGRALKLRVESMLNGAGASPPSASKVAAPALSARGRAADNPIVRRVQEKFSAEIRTVIDYQEKRRG